VATSLDPLPEALRVEERVVEALGVGLAVDGEDVVFLVPEGLRRCGE
jgi:hypothetical protein